MRKFAFIAVLMMLFVALMSVSVVSAQNTSARYLILMRGNSTPADLAQNVANAGGQLVRTLPQVGIAVAVSSDANFASTLSDVRNVSDVSLIPAEMLPQAVMEAPELTAPTAADDLYNTGRVWGVDRVRAPEAWAAGHTGSHNTVVAVIDTGIAWNHPDLAPNVVYVDCYTSLGSYADGACNPYPEYSDHGTHVAGTVAASFDGGRVVGVAPNLGLAGYNTFEPIPGCGVCSYTDSRWAAMIHAADNGFDVISMSLGGLAQFGGQGTNELATFIAADNRVANYVLQQGTVIVASAGNDGLDMNGTLFHIPGDLPGIINVGATGIQPFPFYPQAGSFDIRAFYSNYGASVDVVGPGGDCGEISTCSGNPGTGYNWFDYLVLSTIVAPDPVCAATFNCPVGYGWKGGTSMATPHVSGVVGLVLDDNSNLRPNQVHSLIRRTAENLGDRQQFGHGMVDAVAALGLD